MRAYSIHLLLISLLLTASATGQVEPIQCDRPDQTETPATVPSRHFQMENGFTYEHIEEGYSVSHPSSLIKWGMAGQFEIGVMAEFITVKGDDGMTHGLTPLTFRIKKNLLKEQGLIPVTSLIGYLTVPALSSKKFRTTYYAPAFRFTMQHTLSERFSLGYNLGAEWDGETTTPVYIYTLTTGASLTSKLGGYLEMYGYLAKEMAADHRFNTGLTYLLKDNVMADVSGGISIQDNMNYFLGAGFSFRLKN